jgi:hypothetical protein
MAGAFVCLGSVPVYRQNHHFGNLNMGGLVAIGQDGAMPTLDEDRGSGTPHLARGA